MLCKEGNWCGSIETYCPARYFGGTPMSRTAVIVSGVSTTTSVTTAWNSVCAGARGDEVSRDMVIAVGETTMSLSVSRFRGPAGSLSGIRCPGCGIRKLEAGSRKLVAGLIRAPSRSAVRGAGSESWKLETGNWKLAGNLLRERQIRIQQKDIPDKPFEIVA